MIRLILIKLLKLALPIVYQKVNLPPNVAKTVNSLFNTSFNNQNIVIDVKTNRKLLIQALLQTKSKDEASHIREVLKEQDKRNQRPYHLISLAGIASLFFIPSYISRDQVFEGVFVGIIILIAVIKYQMYRLRKLYQCEYCFTTSKLSDYKKIDAIHTGSYDQFSSNRRYVYSDNFNDYYTTDHYQMRTNFYDRVSKCPCCGYEQIIKVQTSSTFKL